MLSFTPSNIVLTLNKYIIGQDNAKRNIAIAYRNRWRRKLLPDDLKNAITPNNILLIGPSGVGKTEIARQISYLTKSPFIKVEATKFTEVGYVGKDVDSIIRDLTEQSIQMVKADAFVNNQHKAKINAENRILDILLSEIKPNQDKKCNHSYDMLQLQNIINEHKELLRKQLHDGILNEELIEIPVSDSFPAYDFNTRNGNDDINNPFYIFFNNLNNLINVLYKNYDKRNINKTLKIKDALQVFFEEEYDKIVNIEEIKIEALKRVEEDGIVFIDEIDKICINRSNSYDISGEGVQRDLLPLVEGCVVNTKYGIVKTDHILFIAAGAFHSSKPSDLIPELLGRFPTQVKLHSLSITDFYNILCSTTNSIIKQYQSLLQTEKYYVHFTKESLYRIAEIAWSINEISENIGARRLHSILELLLSNISFETNCGRDMYITIDLNYVNEQLKSILPTENDDNYII